MSSRKCKLIVATFLLSTFALLPAGLAAQGIQRRDNDDERHHRRDAHITILQTTDVHHHANGTNHVGLDVDPLTGASLTGAYSRIATYVNYVRATTDHPVILVDSGDWTMGTFYDLTLGTQPLALNFLNLMRYDCVTLGNHEFDYTPKGLAR